MDRDDLERQQILDYVELETEDERVTHAERMKSERVWGNDHEVWDVHTDKGRWWVVTGLTNLYHQEDFKSADEVLSFHIGLMARVSPRQAREAPEAPEPKLERPFRVYEQAADAYNEAEEAEDFQAVGMRCREALVSFSHAIADNDLVPAGVDRPKLSDFVHWTELLANSLASGSHNGDLRSYLKAQSKGAWDYVNAVTHMKQATRGEASIAVDVVGHLITVWSSLMRPDEPEHQCPDCGSYSVKKFWTRGGENRREMTEWLACGACDWKDVVETRTLGLPSPPDGESGVRFN